MIYSHHTHAEVSGGVQVWSSSGDVRQKNRKKLQLLKQQPAINS